MERLWHRMFSLDPRFAGSVPPLQSTRPFVAILAVLIGAFIATLTNRLSSFGIADIRGALHAGFDEGAWITTAQTVGQMLVGPLAVWAGLVWGPRRVLLWSIAVFAGAAALAPLAPDLPSFLVLQFLTGLGSGTFIPLALNIVVRNLPPYLWSLGIAAYAINLEMSLNVSASLEGWFVDHLSWRWVFWQTLPLAAAMAACVAWAVPRQATNRAALDHPDIFGLAACGLGFALIYAALDQGNRLDWLNSGLIVALLAAGGLLVAGFVINEAVARKPWLDLRLFAFSVLPLLMLLIMVLRSSLLGTSFVIPQYLGVVRGFRSLQTGPILLWIGLPQIIIAPIVALALRLVDARVVAGLGFALIAAACWGVANTLTPDWGDQQFLPSQLVQALGQGLAMTSVVFVAVLNLTPKDALSFGAALQIGRLLGGEIGSSFIATFTRVREQTASATIGWHVQAGSAETGLRLAALSRAVIARSGGAVDAGARARALLAGAVRAQAYVRAYADGFAILALFLTLAIAVLVILPPAPDGPASPLRRWWRR